METERHEIGMIGLGVMGRNMLLNMADHGFPVAGYDKAPGRSTRSRRNPRNTTYTAWPTSRISSACSVGRARS